MLRAHAVASDGAVPPCGPAQRAPARRPGRDGAAQRRQVGAGADSPVSRRPRPGGGEEAPCRCAGQPARRRVRPGALPRASSRGTARPDIDLERGSLEIRTALQRVNGELALTAPRTRRSERPVPLPAVCVDALRRRRDLQMEERHAARERWQASGLVFTTRLGTPIEPRNLNRHFYPIRERLGLDVRFHDLRHTCVTLLLGVGVPPHIVRDIVGHSALDVTMNIYAHADMTEKRAALDKLGTLLAVE
ncbi:site-specific integrase [Streptomyces sp. ME03-5709C]|nr:site-specific integrase [Streptomyces sp. ME03-5709C]